MWYLVLRRSKGKELLCDYRYVPKVCQCVRVNYEQHDPYYALLALVGHNSIMAKFIYYVIFSQE